MLTKGYFGLFDRPFDKDRVRAAVSIWLEQFERLEQVCPGPEAGNATLGIQSPEEIFFEDHMQFRVLMGEVFCWVYLSLGRVVIETSSLPQEENTLALDVLLDLPGLREVIDERNEKRLDQLEAEGLI